MARGQLAEAERRFRTVLARDAQNPYALHGLALVAATAGLFSDAFRILAKAQSISPGDPRILADLGTVCIHLDRPADAETAYRAAIERAGPDPNLLMGLGLALKEQGEVGAAHGVFAEAVEVHPDPDFRLLANFAGTCYDLGRYGEAAEGYRQALEIAPESVGLHASMATTRFALGDFENADAHAAKALEIDPRDRKAVTVCIALAYALDRPEELDALLDFERIVRPFPLSPPEEGPGLEDFNERLVDCVRTHPTLMDDRPNKATVNGAHTGNLFAHETTPELDHLRDHIAQSVRDYCELMQGSPVGELVLGTAEPRHLVSWAIYLGDQGHQAPHAHPSALVSGVYYARIPSVVSDDPDSPDGWIRFGRPPPHFEIDEAARTHLVRPVEGTLLLFPSYLWHDTIPFSSEERRVSIAFDAKPGPAPVGLGA